MFGSTIDSMDERRVLALERRSRSGPDRRPFIRGLERVTPAAALGPKTPLPFGALPSAAAAASEAASPVVSPGPFRRLGLRPPSRRLGDRVSSAREDLDRAQHRDEEDERADDEPAECLPGYCGQRFGITSAESSAKAMNAPATSARADRVSRREGEQHGGNLPGCQTGDGRSENIAPSAEFIRSPVRNIRTEVQ